KRFRRGRRADTLRELAPSLLGALVRRRPKTDEFWALRDVSFTVAPGEVLGIIGPNGAGKSTMLSVLSGILWPDRGAVDLEGRVGALIELAAGFHPELTGRENVFLQGAIMGMRRAEITRRFDEIVEFAGVGEFIDTPVKHYSSGMNARLGFSIAAHFDPDVLLIDEVLSVGDRAFQQRAYEYLTSLVRRGVPIVVVSHQLERISSFCDRAILLMRGAVAFEGPAPECVARYIEGVHLTADGSTPCPVVIDALELTDGAYERREGERVTLRLHGRVVGEMARALAVGVRVWSLPSEEIVAGASELASVLELPKQGSFTVKIDLSLNFARGVYRLQGVAWDGTTNAEWVRGPSVLVSLAGREGSHSRVWMDPHVARSKV
ncbi:MAG: ABC transporter ATP-binding protein, partial [bacterium]